jgi:hypothetical protein
MLSTVLTSLQNLIQGRFVVSAFFPMLAFVTVNGAMVAWLNEASRALLHTFLEASTAKSSFLMAVSLIATAMLAYIFSALLPGFQLLLEGRWPAWLISIFVPVQVRQLEDLEQSRKENDRLRGGLENPQDRDWRPNASIRAGATIVPSVNNPRQFVFTATQKGTTAAAAPVFPQIQLQEVADGGVIWRNTGIAFNIQRHDWAASAPIAANATIVPASNNDAGFVFTATKGGTTGLVAPVFPQARLGQVIDGTVTWSNSGVISNVKQPVENWELRLSEARAIGTSHHRGQNTFAKNSQAVRLVIKLERLRRHNKPIYYGDLAEAVTAMETALAGHDADHPEKRTLEMTRARLQQIIDYATDHAYSEDIRLTNKLQFNFGSQRPAPTRMGNVANTIQSYAEGRYNLNFEIFWSRMQRAIQKDKDFSPVLQQAKTQLDFLISCTVLTAIWSFLWIVNSLLLGTGRLSFLLAAAVGPLIAYMWYRAAVAQYQTFADVLRTSVDLFRFDLLKDLHIALPDDLVEEQALWDNLHRIHAYYEPQPLHYQHPKSP